jgi:hypothetical protein
LEEVGKWRCRECGAWNGEEPEAVRIVRDVAKEERPEAKESGDRPEAGAAAETPDSVKAEAEEE